jgi:hypothetical protein
MESTWHFDSDKGSLPQAIRRGPAGQRRRRGVRGGDTSSCAVRAGKFMCERGRKSFYSREATTKYIYGSANARNKTFTPLTGLNVRLRLI